MTRERLRFYRLMWVHGYRVQGLQAGSSFEPSIAKASKRPPSAAPKPALIVLDRFLNPSASPLFLVFNRKTATHIVPVSETAIYDVSTCESRLECTH